ARRLGPGELVEERLEPPRVLGNEVLRRPGPPGLLLFEPAGARETGLPLGGPGGEREEGGGQEEEQGELLHSVSVTPLGRQGHKGHKGPKGRQGQTRTRFYGHTANAPTSVTAGELCPRG